MTIAVAALASAATVHAENLGAVALPPVFHVTEYQGGTGGGLNQLMCPIDRPQLVGIALAVAHEDVDARIGRLAPLCAAIDADHAWNPKDAVEPAATRVGTVRAPLKELRLLCRYDAYAIGAAGFAPGTIHGDQDLPNVLAQLHTYCGTTTGRTVTDLSVRTDSSPEMSQTTKDRVSMNVLCPGGSVGRGLSVYAGVYVDSIAVICGPMIVSGLRPSDRASGTVDYPQAATAQERAKTDPSSSFALPDLTKRTPVTGDSATPPAAPPLRGDTRRLGRSLEDAAAQSERLSPLPTAGQSAPVLIYGFKNDGRLLMYWHSGARPGNSGTWRAPQSIGTTAFSRAAALIPTSSGHFQLRDLDGYLTAVRHAGLRTGTADWEFLATGTKAWSQYVEIVPGPNGVLYGISGDTVDWFRATGAADPEEAWAGPLQVRDGWTRMRRTFSRGDGVLYAVRDDGALLWLRHDGVKDGADAWTGPVEVGSGWGDFVHVASPIAGVIYAVKPNGDLLWYRYKGHATGQGRAWEGPVKVGNGWQGFLGLTAIRAPN